MIVTMPHHLLKLIYPDYKIDDDVSLKVEIEPDEEQTAFYIEPISLGWEFGRCRYKFPKERREIMRRKIVFEEV